MIQTRESLKLCLKADKHSLVASVILGGLSREKFEAVLLGLPAGGFKSMSVLTKQIMHR